MRVRKRLRKLEQRVDVIAGRVSALGEPMGRGPRHFESLTIDWEERKVLRGSRVIASSPEDFGGMRFLVIPIPSDA